LQPTHPNVPFLKTMWQWEHASQKDSLWVLETKWTQRPELLASLVKSEAHAFIGEDLVGDPVFDQIYAEMTHVALSTEPNLWKDRASVSVCLQETVVRIGDTLRVTLASNGFPQGSDFEVVGFSEPTSRRDPDRVFARLSGVKEPVLLGDKVLSGFEVVKAKKTVNTVNTVVLPDGFEIRVGAIITSNNERMLRLKEKAKTVRCLQQDDDGDVLALLSDEDDSWVYLTHDGGKPLPCIGWLIPQLKDGTFTYSDKSISVGDVILRNSRGDHSILLTVQNIMPLTSGSGVYLIQYAELSGRITEKLFEDGKFAFAWEAIRFVKTDKKVEFKDQVCNLNVQNHVLILKPNGSLPYGTIHRIIGFAQSTDADAHPNDLCLLFDGGIKLPLIKQSEWVAFVETEYMIVNLTGVVEGVELKQGMKFQSRSNIVGSGIQTGDVVEVLCFIENKETQSVQEVVFTNGYSVPVLGWNSNWQTTLKKEVTKVSHAIHMTNTELKVGDRVMYLGGDPYRISGFDNSESLSTPGKIVDIDGHVAYHIFFDKMLPIGNGIGRNYQWIRQQYLRRISPSKRLFFTDGNKRIAHCMDFAGQARAVTNELLGHRSKLIERGKELYVDGRGQMIHLGDLAQALSYNWNVYPDQLPNRMKMKHGLVVHFSRRTYDNLVIYLLHEEVVDQRILSSMSGYRSMPEWLRNPDILNRITVCEAVGSERLKLIEPE